MTDSDDTAEAPQSDAPDTVVVDSHTINVDRAELAWSLDDETEPERRTWRATYRNAALIVAGASLVGAVVWVAGHAISGKQQLSNPTTTAAAQPKPSVAQSSTVPAAPTSAPVFDAEDQQVLNQLGVVEGYIITDPPLVIQHARRFCALTRQGLSNHQATEALESESISTHHPIESEIVVDNPRQPLGAARSPAERAWWNLTADAMGVYHCDGDSLPAAPATITAPPPAAPPPSVTPPTPCYFSPATPECPPKGLTPEQRENW